MPGSFGLPFALTINPSEYELQKRRFLPYFDLHPRTSQGYSITSSARASSDAGTVKADRLRGPEIDHQLVLGRRLHRQIGRFLALEDAVNVARRAAELVGQISP